MAVSINNIAIVVGVIKDSSVIYEEDEYVEYTDGVDTYRTGVRDVSFVVDKELTATGFTGTVDVDWENVRSFVSSDVWTWRKGVRKDAFVIDNTLTVTAFEGIEDTDWENDVYISARGGLGNRTGIVTVTTHADLDATPGEENHLVDGSVLDENWYFVNGENVVGRWIQFDFGVSASKIVTEVVYYQDGTTAQGVWRWQCSNNGTDWTNIGGTFDLGGVATQIITELSANTTGYRYYRILGVSGTSSSAPWVYEFEFKIIDA